MVKYFSKASLILLTTLMMGLCLAVSDCRADNPPSLEITSVVVTKPSGSGCSYRWAATAKNIGTVGLNVSLQAYQGNSGGSWQPASGGSVGYLSPNQSGSDSKVFTRKANKNQLSMRIYYQGTVIAEKTVELPAQPQLSFDISNCNLTSNGYTVSVRNLLSESVSDFLVQGYTASAANPTAWAAGGGMGVDCLNAQGTYQHTGPRPAANEIVKIAIYNGSTLVTEKVFDLSLAPANQGGEQTGTNKDQSQTIKPAKKTDSRTTSRRNK